MNAAAHTPGPWNIDTHALGIWAPSEKGGETKIFDIRGWGYLTGHGYGALALPFDKAKDIQRANGLIAAAGPDLLAACEEFVRKVEAGEARSTRSYQQMKAAIAKARGSQP